MRYNCGPLCPVIVARFKIGGVSADCGQRHMSKRLTWKLHPKRHRKLVRWGVWWLEKKWRWRHLSVRLQR
jgi:hypothetical protein